MPNTTPVTIPYSLITLFKSTEILLFHPSHVFSEGFIHLTSEDKARQVLFVAGYIQHETRPVVPFSGAGIGETLFMHREEGPYVVDL